MKPRNVKQAFEQDFKVKSIYAKGSKRIRVSFERRFPKPDKCNFVEFWIDRDYFKRNYPETYERF